MNSFWSKTAVVGIVAYAIVMPAAFHTLPLPAYAKGLLGGLLIVFATAYWGLKGGLVSAVWSTIIILLQHLHSSTLSFIPTLAGAAVYFATGAGLGKVIDMVRFQRKKLNETIDMLEKVHQELKSGENRYKELFKNMMNGAAIYEVKENGNKFIFKDFNKSAERIDKISKCELIGREICDVFPQVKYFGILDVFKRVWETGQPEHYPVTLYKDDHIFSWRENYVYKLQSGEICTIYDDATGRMQAESISKRYQTLFEHIRIIMLFINEDGSIAETNIAAVRSFGYTMDELLSMSVLDLFVPDDQYTLLEKITEKEYESVLIEARLQQKDGSFFDAEISLQKATINDESNILCVIHDITERKKAIDTISYMAFHDSLTGLANRKNFTDRLELAVAQVKRTNQMLSLLSLDLDNFKNINDTLGHLAGDQLLKDVAGRLTALIRETDTVARMGGDEFIILQQNVDKKENTAALAKRILKSLHQPFKLNGHEVNVTTSIGIALSTEECRDTETLFKNADIAMYCAKNRCKNNYQFYTPGMEIGCE